MSSLFFTTSFFFSNKHKSSFPIKFYSNSQPNQLRFFWKCSELFGTDWENPSLATEILCFLSYFPACFVKQPLRQMPPVPWAAECLLLRKQHPSLPFSSLPSPSPYSHASALRANRKGLPWLLTYEKITSSNTCIKYNSIPIISKKSCLQKCKL